MHTILYALLIFDFNLYYQKVYASEIEITT